jgi:hypothetical protein
MLVVSLSILCCSVLLGYPKLQTFNRSLQMILILLNCRTRRCLTPSNSAFNSAFISVFICVISLTVIFASIATECGGAGPAITMIVCSGHSYLTIYTFNKSVINESYTMAGCSCSHLPTTGGNFCSNGTHKALIKNV